ncbi:MAG TPA: hypothetical protein VE933_11925, partial [Chitinophagaceae bacterium]|nr:hypothetical protein [Chitinophagaceae bacterium]
VSLKTSKNATAGFKLLSLYIDSNKTFDIQSILGTTGNSKTMTLTSTFDGVYTFYSRGTFVAESGTVTIEGTQAQSVGGTSGTAFYNFTINNPAGVTLQLAESVSNLLTLSDGLLNTTATNIISCTSSANATIGSPSSFVNGPMIQTIASSALTTRNFPLGKGTSYRPAVLTVTHSNSTSVTYAGEMFNTSATSLGYIKPATINKVSNTRYWDFTRQAVANFTSATMTLYYAADDTVPDKNRVAVVHDNGSGAWTDYGGTGSANITGNITSGSITSFKTKFALGFPPSPLPVVLISFMVKKSRHTVLCDWETASELNSSYFIVERSPDGIDYSTAGSVKGAGNSTIHRSYHFEDVNPLPDGSYYRLKQVDVDGKYKYSDAAYVFFSEPGNPYTFFPNPSPGVIHIKKPGTTMEGVQAFVQDMNGKQIEATLNLSANMNELIVDIDPSQRSTTDFFVLNIVSPNGTVKEKVLVDKQ